MDPDLMTVGRIMQAMLRDARFDLASGKAIPVWDKHLFLERLRASSGLFSQWCAGRQIPSPVVVHTLIVMAKEMGERGVRYIEPLQQWYESIMVEKRNRKVDFVKVPQKPY